MQTQQNIYADPFFLTQTITASATDLLCGLLQPIMQIIIYLKAAQQEHEVFAQTFTHFYFMISEVVKWLVKR